MELVLPKYTRIEDFVYPQDREKYTLIFEMEEIEKIYQIF